MYNYLWWNNTNFSEYVLNEDELYDKNPDDTFEVPDTDETDDNVDDAEKLVDVVYKEGISDINPYVAIVDSACPKTVASLLFIEAWIESKGGNVSIRKERENENFKFGPSKIYNSYKSY